MEPLITEAEKSICVSVVARECFAFITLLVNSCVVFSFFFSSAHKHFIPSAQSALFCLRRKKTKHVDTAS